MRIRRLTIAGVALAAAIGVAGCGPTDDKAAPAAPAATTTKPADAATALGAAAAKSSAQTLRMTLTMSGAGVTMSGVSDPKTKNSDMKMNLGALGGDAQMVRIGDDLYIKFSNSAITQFTGGKAWIHMNMAGTGSPLGTVDPIQAAKALESAATVERVGDHDFKGTLDIAKAQELMGQKAPASAPAGAKSMPFTAKTDDQGRLIEMTVDMSAYSPQAGTMKTTYSDFGTPVSVTAPPKSQVGEMPDQLKKMMPTS
jgi:hypothetical protein